jgi:hypothetical protein
MLPSRNIMNTGRWQDSQSYRVACDCGDHRHDVTMWIELEPDADIKSVTATFYVEGESPAWRTGWNRWRAIWNLLWHGRHTVEHALILDQESAMNLARALEQSVRTLTSEVDQK